MRKFFLCIIPLFLIVSCSNFVHELIPPQDKEIVSLNLKNENLENIRTTEIRNEKNITLTVPSTTDITKLIPIIKVSDGASVLPIEFHYLQAAFPSIDLLTLAVKLNEFLLSNNAESWVFDFIRQNPDFNVPQLSFPINFSNPVYFLVISGQATSTLYKVTVKKESSSSQGGSDSEQDNNSDDKKTESEKEIISFIVGSQEGNSKINEKSVEFSIGADNDISALYPIVSVSKGAAVLPLTQKYLLSLDLTFEQMLDFYSGYSTTLDLEKYCGEWLAKNSIELPQTLSIPIDFRQSVIFAVVGSDKSVKLWTIKCNVIKNNPFIEKLAFTKYNNSGLMKDSVVSEIASGIYFAEVVYPVEYSYFSLIPEFSYYGDRVTYQLDSAEETELVSGETEIPFTFSSSKMNCSIAVYKGERKVVYNLTLKQTFDPDTIRSITDFRFYKSKNKDIKNSSVASIFDEGDTGQITITVNYENNKPDILIPDFYSPGTVSVEHTEQTSGVSQQDFSAPIKYLCVSKDKQFSRLYTVLIEFNKVEPAKALINSFSVPSYLNKGISYDTHGVINHESGTIDIEIPYSCKSEPYELMPLFSGTGRIIVDGIVQSSGYSRQNFSKNVYYKVISSDDENVSKQYVVRASFKSDADSSCEITSFKFLKGSQNPKLAEDVSALVVQRTKEIFVYLPYGSGSRDSLMAATFDAAGQVFVEEELQTSGISLNDFSKTVVYRVVSANGKNSKNYTVTVQETGSIIFVNNLAAGHNNGSSWSDAYTRLDSALESVSDIAAQAPCEIWICDNGTEYKAGSSNISQLCGTISIKGGFSGTESTAVQRENSKKTKLSGYSFESTGKDSLLTFENLKILDAQKFLSLENIKSSIKNVDIENSEINVTGDSSTITIENSLFDNTIADIACEEASINNTKFSKGKIDDKTKKSSVLNSSFLQTEYKQQGTEAKIKSCSFSGTSLINFNVQKSIVDECNFNEYEGIIDCLYSTSVKNISFTDKVCIKTINEKSSSGDYCFEIFNCNNLEVPLIKNIDILKIEKSDVKIPLVKNEDSMKQLFIEDSDCSYMYYGCDSYPNTQGDLEFYINNSKFHEKKYNFFSMEEYKEEIRIKTFDDPLFLGDNCFGTVNESSFTSENGTVSFCQKGDVSLQNINIKVLNGEKPTDIHHSTTALTCYGPGNCFVDDMHIDINGYISVGFWKQDNTKKGGKCIIQNTTITGSSEASLDIHNLESVSVKNCTILSKNLEPNNDYWISALSKDDIETKIELSDISSNERFFLYSFDSVSATNCSADAISVRVYEPKSECTVIKNCSLNAFSYFNSSDSVDQDLLIKNCTFSNDAEVFVHNAKSITLCNDNLMENPILFSYDTSRSVESKFSAKNYYFNSFSSRNTNFSTVEFNDCKIDKKFDIRRIAISESISFINVSFLKNYSFNEGKFYTNTCKLAIFNLCNFESNDNANADIFYGFIGESFRMENCTLRLGTRDKLLYALGRKECVFSNNTIENMNNDNTRLVLRYAKGSAFTNTGNTFVDGNFIPGVYQY